MGHMTLTDGIAIWQLVYYVAALGGSIWISHHPRRWMFCPDRNRYSRLGYALDYCGHYWISGSVAVALILCIVGGVSTDTPTEIGDQSTTQAGVILFLIVLVLIVLLTVGAAVGRNTTGRGEGRLLGAVAVSLPMLLIRIIYSFLVVFSKDSHFSMASGSTSSILTDLFMARIEEMLVILVYLWAGITQEAVSENDGGVKRSKEEKLLYRAGRGDFGGGKLGMASLAVHTLVGLFRDDKRKQPAGGVVEMNV